MIRAAIRVKHSSHTFISFTGGFPGRQEGLEASVLDVSSAQMSPRSSDILTNSRARTRLTAFGGNEAAGPVLCRERGIEHSSSAEPEGWVGTSLVAAAAKMSRPEGSPLVGLNVDRGGRLAISGISPSLACAPRGMRRGNSCKRGR